MNDKERKTLINDILSSMRNKGYHSLGSQWLKRMSDEELTKKYEEEVK